MSGADDPRPPHERLAELLRARLAGLGPCPVCGSVHWHNWGAIELRGVRSVEKMVEVAVQEDDRAGEFDGMNALPLVCGGCGYIAVFHLGVLLGTQDLPPTI